MLQVRGRQKTLEVWSININPACFSQKTWETISCSWKSTHFKDDGFLLDYRINPLKKKKLAVANLFYKKWWFHVVPKDFPFSKSWPLPWRFDLPNPTGFPLRPSVAIRLPPSFDPYLWATVGWFRWFHTCVKKVDANYLTQNKRISWQHAGI